MSERAVNGGMFLSFLKDSITLYATLKLNGIWQSTEIEIPFAQWSVAGDGKLTLGTVLEWDIDVPSQEQAITVQAVRFRTVSNTLVFAEDVTENNEFETEGKFRITSFKIPVTVVT